MLVNTFGSAMGGVGGVSPATSRAQQKAAAKAAARAAARAGKVSEREEHCDATRAAGGRTVIPGRF